jgi:hypothetical protein
MQKADRLTSYPIKLYSRKASDRTKTIFNYRLLHAQPTVECTYGFSISQWRNLKKSTEAKGDTNVETVKFVALLHNRQTINTTSLHESDKLGENPPQY